MNNQSKKLLTVTASPHIKSFIKTHHIMSDVILALLPALVWAVYLYGLRALTISAISVCSCVIFEYLYRKIMKKSFSLGDLSAVVTGLLLAFSLPVSVPLWIPVLGSFFAIVVAKQLYGGMGKNVVNPALAGRVFLFFTYSDELCAYTVPGQKLSPFKISVADEINEIIAGATPLETLKSGVTTEYDTVSTLIGNLPGCIGEVSATLLLLTGIYLIIRRVITWHIPVTYITTVALISFAFPLGGADRFEFMCLQLFSGALMLGAFFMATDYVTSPVTSLGRIIYGIGCGLITIFIRYFGAFPEGVSFAILIMNLFVWYLDKATKSRVFGGVRKNEK